jgi:transcriptional regulator with XRE-family HTH domain
MGPARIEDDYDSFAVLLRRYRGAANLTQEQIAERAGLSVQAVSLLERGVRRAPRSATVEALADALRLDVPERRALVAASQRRLPDPAKFQPLSNKIEAQSLRSATAGGAGEKIRRLAVVMVVLLVTPALASDTFSGVPTANRTAVRSPQHASCSPPSSPPSSRSYFQIAETAPGRSGPYNSCPEVGVLYIDSNGVGAPQWAYCRQWGSEVTDGRGHRNHWWLWTLLDNPHGRRGWVSAYYIESEGNDQADDVSTKTPIPNC